MKLLKFSVYILVICTAVFFSSCKKDRYSETKQVSINATVAATADYQLNLAQYGDADDVAVITTQATNAAISRIDNTLPGFAPVYHYSADIAKLSSSDKVIITVSEGGRGGRCRKGDETVITINFTIE